jgi:hypothetical protein
MVLAKVCVFVLLACGAFYDHPVFMYCTFDGILQNVKYMPCSVKERIKNKK